VRNGAQEERELKFTPAPNFNLVAVLADLTPSSTTDSDGGHSAAATPPAATGWLHADEPRTEHLHAVYYDTADLRLARSGASLRHPRGRPGPSSSRARRASRWSAPSCTSTAAR